MATKVSDTDSNRPSRDNHGRNGVPNIPLPVNRPELEHIQHLTLSPTTTSHKAARPPVEFQGMEVSELLETCIFFPLCHIV